MYFDFEKPRSKRFGYSYGIVSHKKIVSECPAQFMFDLILFLIIPGHRKLTNNFTGYIITLSYPVEIDVVE